MRTVLILLTLGVLGLAGWFLVTTIHSASDSANSSTTPPSGINIQASNANGADIQIGGIHIKANSSGANIQVPGYGSITASQQGANIQAQNGAQQINVTSQSK